MAGLLRLVQQAPPMGSQDVDYIGIQSALKIAAIKEAARYQVQTYSPGKGMKNSTYKTSAVVERGKGSLDFTSKLRGMFSLGL